MISRRKAVLLLLSALLGKEAFGWTTIVPQSRRLVQKCRATTTTEEAVLDAAPASAADATGELAMAASRGKVNEIDFCIAPADVSLSRFYSNPQDEQPSSSSSSSQDVLSSSPTMSLTRALNNASNRAVRRILLARSWPSAEALNLSLRRVAEAEKEREAARRSGLINTTRQGGGKCPVPRPILNVLTRNRRKSKTSQQQPIPRSRTDEEYVADQLRAFQERYGSLPGYSYAEAYLESILLLATAGVESPRASQVLQDNVYDESYKRVLSVLKSVGVVFERGELGRNRIASKMIDQDICLSMMDKLQMKQESSSSSLPSPPPPRVEASTDDNDEKEEDSITKDDLGGVLLSASEPSMTRQLNILSNIVQRALLFGGDQELLVLAETLDADRSAFIERWYPNTDHDDDENETRPGVQFFNSLVQLLRDCYEKGVIVDLESPVPLSQSYANSYERLVASAVELGSGYLKPQASNIVTAMPKPRTAQEELGRFAVWESTFRAQQQQPVGVPDETSSYPADLEGTWEVRDEIGGETIGISTVRLEAGGQVGVGPTSLEGLRWRLDPGPTHLDTCTFQVLSTVDGTILQYRGFLDRGARLEARFSKRPLTIRGSVMFQMRDGGSVDYYKDMLPINYRTGTTKFVMTKKSSKSS